MKKHKKGCKVRFWVSVLIVAIMLTSGLQGIASAKNPEYFSKDGMHTIRLKFSFEKPVIESIRYGETLYYTVDMEGLPKYGDTGEPVLPVKPVNVLLPYGTEMDDIEVIASDPILIGKGYLVEPRPEPVIIGEDPEPPTPDEVIYESSELFPGELYSVVTTQYFRGFPILTINLHPVQYLPKTGEIYYYEKMVLNVKTKDSSPNELYRGLENDMKIVKKMVDNPQTLLTYPGPYPHHSYEYIIITNEALNATPGPYNFQALRDAKIAKGLGAKIVTVEWINSSFSGVDLPEKIRNFIRYAYQNWHTEYVLLGGDADLPGSQEYGNIVPARYLFVSPDDGNPNDSYATEMPSDIYYACLDGSFNSDGDALWGEPHDGPGGSDVDLRAEVYVGRAPVDNATEVQNFVRKTLAYENSIGGYLNNVTLFAEYLGFGGPVNWATNNMEMLINGSAAHGVVTVGIPAEPPADGRYNIYKIYEEYLPGGDNAPSARMNVNQINNGTHLIFHDGHGSEDWVMNMSKDHYSYYGAPNDYANMTNTDYFFAYSIACDPGAFDNAGPVHGWTDDSIAEDLVVGEYGAFAVVMNARYGWGYGFSTDGPGTAFEREFVDAIFGEGHRCLGKANQDSKEDNLWRLNQDCMRWTYYSENLLGDPEVEIKPPEVKGNDAGVREINYPGELTGTGLNIVNATIRNYGTNDLTNIPVNCSIYRLNLYTLFDDDMESGASKWTVVDGNGDGDTWTIVEPTDSTRYSSATHAFKCTAGDTYNANADDSLISQAIDCSGYDSVTAEFYLWFYGQYSGWSGYLDYGSVYLSDDDGLTWTLVKTNLTYVNFEGNLPGVRYSFPVEAYVNLTSQVRIKFTWKANDITQNEGMYVDDVKFYAYEPVALVFSDDVTISSLQAGELTDVEFSAWNVTSAGWYGINVSTRLAGDEYSPNNYVEQITYIMANNDVGVKMINYPTGMKCTGTYVVNATVENYGFADQTGVVVNCTIRNSADTIVFTDETTVDIASLEKKYVEFASWNANVEDTYTINVTTLLPGDEGPYNDYKEVTLVIENIDDVATMAINYPPAGTMLGGYYRVNATVKNNGTTTPTFNVNCTIRDSTNAIVYTHEITGLSVPPGEMKDVEFPTWNATTEGTYDINVTTVLAGDEDPTNDYKNITVTINNIDDVGATAINYPTGVQPTGSHIINATLENFGNINKSNVLTNCSVVEIISPVTLLSEDFEGYSPMQKIWPPTGWTLVNGTGNYWTYGDTPNSGDYNAEVYGSGGSSVDCWLITNLTHVPATDPKVTFYYRGGYDGYYTDYYVAFEVNISTTGTDPSDFAGNQVYDSGLTFSPDYNDPYGKVIVDLSAYAGMDVYIGFHCYYQDSSYYNLQLDDVWVGSLSMVDLLPTESFTPTPFPPMGWTVLNEDGDSYQWEAYSTTSAHGGSYVARVHWNSAGCDDWLITKQTTVPSGGTFSFWAKSYSSSYLEDFEVRLSTTGTNPSDFTVLLDSVTDTPYSWTQYSYDLSAYAGQDVYLAVRCVSVNEYYLYVDDFTLPDGTTEGFEKIFPPSGWTADSDWQQGTGHDGGTAYIEEVYGVEQDQWLITPTIDCTGMSDVHLTFWYNFYNSTYSGDSYGEIYVSNDDGTTWNLADRISPAGTETGDKDLDISSWADNEPQVKVGFRFYSTSGTSAYDYWHVDDVWVGAKSETTTWSEGFEEIIPESGWPPSGWTIDIVSGTDVDNNWTISDGTGTHPSGVTPFGDYMAQYNAYSISSGNSARLYTPAINFATSTNHRMTFYMYHSDDGSWYDDKLVIQVSLDGSTWTNVTEFMRYDSTDPGWVQHLVDLSAYDGEPTVYIGFLGVSDYGYSIYIDNIEIGYGGINLLFSEEKTFDIPAYSTIYAEFGPWNIATEGNYTIYVTTLMPGDEDDTNNQTQTTVWINDIYDVGATSINYPMHGQTYPMGSYAVNATFENFGNVNLANVPVNLSIYKQLGGGVLLTEGFEGGIIPPDWTVINADGDSYQWEAYSTTEAHGGSYVARVHWNSAGCDDWLITPQISIPAGTTTFSFWAKSWSSYSLEDFEVRLSTTGTNPSDFTVLLDSVTGTPYDWTQYSYDLSSYAGQDVYLAIRCTSVNKWYLYIDDVEVFASGGLDLVYGVDTTISSLPGGTTVDYTFPPWNANEEGNYLIKVTTELSADEDNTNNATSISVTINNIDDVGVTSINTPPDLIGTEWNGAINATVHNFGNYDLTTPFDVKCTINQLVGGGTFLEEGFENGVPPPGWMVNNSDPPNAGWEDSTSYARTGSHCVRGDPAVSNGPSDEWLISSPITITDPATELSFWYRSESSYALSFEVLVSTTGTDKSDFTDQIFVADNFTSTTYLNAVISLSSYVGQTIYIAFHLYWAESAYWYMFIDDVLVSAPPVYSMVYEDTETITSINMGEDLYVEFDPWSPSAEGDYIINVTTLLSTDEDNSNNATEKWITVADIPDVGVISINAPVGGGGSIYSSDFDSNDGGWTATADWDPVGDWEWTNNYDVSNYVGSHTPPPSAHSGSGLWGTVLYDDYTNAGGTSYLNKTFDLTGVSDAKLSFWSWSDIFGPYDYGRVLVNGDELLRIDDYNPTDWEYYEVDLSAYDGMSNVEISFAFYATTVVNYAGWYIDDVEITAGSGGVGGLPAGNYTVNATVRNYGTTTETFDVQCTISNLVHTVMLEDDMESGANGWTHLAISGNNLWHLTTARYSSPTHSWYCGDEMTGEYEDNMIDFLISPAINMAGASQAILSFKHWYDTEPGFDYAYVTASPDNYTFYILNTYSGNSGGWVEDSVDITSYINSTTGLINVGFIFVSDSSVHSYEGWYIDDVTITKVSGAGIIYSSIETVHNLTPGEESYVEFSPPWDAKTGDYTITVETLLTGDTNPANDEREAKVTIVGCRPPVTHCSIMGQQGDNGWYTDTVSIHLYATDPDGDAIAYTRYRINGGEWQNYTGTVIQIATEGHYTIEYYSADVSGMVEDVKSRSFGIASSTPSTQCILDGELGENGWYTSNVRVILVGTAYICGIQYTRYRLDGGGWQIYRWPFVVTDEGTHTIEYYSVSNSGIIESPSSTTFKIDHTAPVVNVTYPNGGEILSDTVTITWEASDTLDTSLSIDLLYSNDAGFTWHEIVTGIENTGSYTWDISAMPSGSNYMVKVVATDDAGNMASDESDGTFTIVHSGTLSVNIVKTRGHLYLMDRAIMPLPGKATIIIGGVTIEVEVQSEIGVEKVNFYVDNKLKFTDYESPYLWMWDEFAIGLHEIKVTAYDAIGQTATDKAKVLIFNLF